jgi:hypothetical protein
MNAPMDTVRTTVLPALAGGSPTGVALHPTYGGCRTRPARSRIRRPKTGARREPDTSRNV